MTNIKEQRRALAKKAHSLKPIVTIGKNGVTEPLLAELDSALTAHELLKIKLPSAISLEDLEEIASQVNALAVKVIGRVGILYRENSE